MNKKRSGPVILANEDNWSWGTDPKTHRLFVFLLQNATPVARPYRDAILRRGDVYATVLQLAEETGLSAREVRTALSHMLISGDIESIRYGRNRVIHITRYDWYVSPSDQEEQHLPESVHSVDSHTPADANADSGDPDDVPPAFMKSPRPADDQFVSGMSPYGDMIETGNGPYRGEITAESRPDRCMSSPAMGGYRGACYYQVPDVCINSVVNSGEEREKGVSLTLTPFSHTPGSNMQHGSALPESRESQEHSLDRAQAEGRESRDQSARPGFNRPSQASSASGQPISVQPGAASAGSNSLSSVQTSSACSASNRDISAHSGSAPAVHTLSNPAEGFDEFWAVYPRKIAKGRAVRAWNELRPDAATRLEIMKSLALMIKSDAWKTQNGRFIPYPANWLNDRRWEDDPAEADRRFISNSVLPIQSYRQRDYSEQIESDEEMFERLKRGVGTRSA